MATLEITEDDRTSSVSTSCDSDVDCSTDGTPPDGEENKGSKCGDTHCNPDQGCVRADPDYASLDFFDPLGMDRCVTCSGDTDDVPAWFCGGDDPDADGDGYPDRRALLQNFSMVDTVVEYDCDDTNPTVNPFADEFCQEENDPYGRSYGVDNDCNPQTVFRLSDGSDSELLRFDNDSDGFVDKRCRNWNPDAQAYVYAKSDGTPVKDPDCNDSRPDRSPGLEESCDTIDNDCDGVVDEDKKRVRKGLEVEFCVDEDGDGYPDEDKRIRACPGPGTRGYVECSTVKEGAWDCDDKPGIGLLSRPGLDEQCDKLDNDCDGRADKSRDNTPIDGEILFGETVIKCDPILGDFFVDSCPPGREWCGTAPPEEGCDTDITQLDQCGTCDKTACSLACTEEQNRYDCEEVLDVSVGMDFACATTTLQKAVCWGRGTEGRLGNASKPVEASAPVWVIGPRGVKSLCTGVSHSCAIVGDEGLVVCWGRNQEGQLGSNPDEVPFSASPVAVRSGDVGSGTTLAGATSLACGWGFGCALLDSGSVACWGTTGPKSSSAPSVVAPESSPKYVTSVQETIFGPQPVSLAGVTQISVGFEHGCAVVESGEVMCWGSNVGGQLGLDPASTQEEQNAVAIAGLPVPVQQVAVGDYHSCALADGRAYCWGSNEFGQLGSPPSPYNPTPTEVAEAPDAVQVLAGYGVSCVLTETGEVHCWGRKLDDETISASDIVSPTPYRIENLPSVDAVALGRNACARSGDKVRCWGENDNGQLGIGIKSFGRRAPSPDSTLNPVQTN